MADLPEGFKVRKPKGDLPEGFTVRQAQPVAAPVVDERQQAINERINDPLFKQLNSKTTAFSGSGIRGATLHGSDHVFAGINSLAPFGKEFKFLDYKNNLDSVRQIEDAREALHPKTAMAGKVSGSVAGIGKLQGLKLLPSQLAGRLPQLAQGASRAGNFAKTTAGMGLDGAIIAGTDAFLNGRDAVQEAQMGGAIGAGLNVITRGIAGPAFNTLMRGKKPNVPTTQDLLGRAKETRKQLKDMGAVYSPDQLKQLALGITDDIPIKGIDAVGGKIGSTAKRIVKNSDDPATLEQLDKLRQRIDLPLGASNTDKGLAQNLRGHIDEFMQKVDPSGTTGSKVKAVLDESRDYTRRGRSAERLENIIKEARDNVGGTLGGRLKTQEDVRRQLKQLMKNKDFNFYTKAEQAAIRKVVRGGPVDNVTRLLGKAQPTGVVSGGIGGASIMSAGPMGAAVPIVGTIARQAADHSTRRGMQDVIRLIQAGSPQAAKRVQSPMQKKVTDPELHALLVRMGLAPAVLTTQNP